MESNTPFDGVMFKVETKDDQGTSRSTEALWDARPWKREWLQDALADLKSCRFTRFTDNFLRFNATPGDLDWARRPRLDSPRGQGRGLRVAGEAGWWQGAGD